LTHPPPTWFPQLSSPKRHIRISFVFRLLGPFPWIPDALKSTVFSRGTYRVSDFIPRVSLDFPDSCRSPRYHLLCLRGVRFVVPVALPSSLLRFGIRIPLFSFLHGGKFFVWKGNFVTPYTDCHVFIRRQAVLGPLGLVPDRSARGAFFFMAFNDFPLPHPTMPLHTPPVGWIIPAEDSASLFSPSPQSVRLA